MGQNVDNIIGVSSLQENIVFSIVVCRCFLYNGRLLLCYSSLYSLLLGLSITQGDMLKFLTMMMVKVTISLRSSVKMYIQLCCQEDTVYFLQLLVKIFYPLPLGYMLCKRRVYLFLLYLLKCPFVFELCHWCYHILNCSEIDKLIE